MLSVELISWKDAASSWKSCHCRPVQMLLWPRIDAMVPPAHACHLSHIDQ